MQAGDRTETEVRERLGEILADIPFVRLRGWKSQPAGGEGGVDLAIDLIAGGRPWRILIEVKASGEPRIARSALQKLQALPSKGERGYCVLAAPYIGPSTRAICKEAGVGFVDLAGNCRLVFDQVFIERRGLPNPRLERRPLRSIFAPRATRILRVLLENPKRQWQVKQLAAEASVSLGLAFKVKARLLEMEYARGAPEGVELAKPEDLLRAWGATFQARKRQQVDCYAPGDPPEVEAALRKYCGREKIRYAFALFSGAARVAPFARYARGFAYVDGDLGAVTEALAWKPVPSGPNFTLLSPYDEGVWYGVRKVEGDAVVSDVQLYLDLVGYKGRGEEAATFILEQRLRPRW